MHNLIRMDLYRMRKNMVFRVCLILAFVFALAQTPLEKLLYDVARIFASGTEVDTTFPTQANLSTLLASPLSTLGSLLALISISSFFYADIEHGYIKNIAGQMSKRGYTVLSKFWAAAVHNLIFIAVCLAGEVLGTIFFRRIVVDENVLKGLTALGQKYLLLQGISTILLLCGAGLQAKSLSTVIAVLMGSGLMSLIYSGIDMGLHQIPFLKNVSISNYMPDQLMSLEYPPVERSLLVAAVVIILFLALAVRRVNRKDIK